MSTHQLPVTLEEDMRKMAERQKAKAWVGEPAGPRTFVKPGVYTGAELRNRRETIWDTVPSVMGGQRIPRRA
jgi:hypothetical protein